MELLWVLGDTYAEGHGKWNDRRAMARCLETLPDSPFKSEVAAELCKEADAYNRTASLPKGLRAKYMKEFKHLDRRRRRHRWLFRKDKPEVIRRWEFLKYILSEWGAF